ncbi:unnamed protein product [Moneuplotes crassus]|uniref:Homeobox domain-containing protein n=1 Tax=Euplotes crassus TaxID=5936 RepID=A0AAD1XLB7_EUPCR|nr:unnamed protein product [Moneuplotes crassus]
MLRIISETEGNFLFETKQEFSAKGILSSFRVESINLGAKFHLKISGHYKVGLSQLVRINPNIFIFGIIFMNIKRQSSDSDWKSEVYSQPENEKKPGRLKRPNFSSEIVKLLTKWVRDHPEYPYPNTKEFEILRDRTGLSEKQLRVWFTNTRKRKLKITRENFRMKQNTFIRNQVEVQEPVMLKKAPVPTFDQEVQTDIIVKENLGSHQQGESQQMFLSNESLQSSQAFIKNVIFVAEVVDLNEMCLCDDTLTQYLTKLGYCHCSSLLAGLNFEHQIS